MMLLESDGQKKFNWFLLCISYHYNPDKLEIYRHFRSTKYQHIDQFYNNFFHLRKLIFQNFFFKQKNFIKDYLKGFDYYSFKNDKWFRFLRDKILKA